MKKKSTLRLILLNLITLFYSIKQKQHFFVNNKKITALAQAQKTGIATTFTCWIPFFAFLTAHKPNSYRIGKLQVLFLYSFLPDSLLLLLENSILKHFVNYLATSTSYIIIDARCTHSLDEKYLLVFMNHRWKK